VIFFENMCPDPALAIPTPTFEDGAQNGSPVGWTIATLGWSAIGNLRQPRG
jgi:hypothetical protein